MPNFTTAPAEGQVITYVRPVITCPKPTNLVCTAYTTTTATLSWTEKGTATNRVLQYSTDNTFATGVQSVNVSNTPSTQLIGLTAETTYYARVRPDCDENKWSTTCEFKPSAAQIVTIGSGTDTEYYLPTHTYYNYSYSQQIYTAAEIGEPGTITSVSFKGDQGCTRDLDVYYGEHRQGIFLKHKRLYRCYRS